MKQLITQNEEQSLKIVESTNKTYGFTGENINLIWMRSMNFKN